MSTQPDNHSRSVLPIPEVRKPQLTAFDAEGGGGFEYFYGFMGGEVSQYDPALYEGAPPVEPPVTAEEGCRRAFDQRGTP